MKEELTTKMHSEFHVRKVIDKRHKVGSALKSAISMGGGKENLKMAMKMYAISIEEYVRWRDYWAKRGVKVD